jgi:hypothetical protein
VEDRVRLFSLLLQRVNNSGRWDYEQFDFAALCFALHFFHHRQLSVCSGADYQSGGTISSSCHEKWHDGKPAVGGPAAWQLALDTEWRQ